MPKRTYLTDFVSDENFAKVQKIALQNFNLPLEIVDTRGQPINPMCSGNCHPKFCRLVRQSKLGKEKCIYERLRSINIAIETGQPYISICHAGIVLACVPIMQKDIPLGGLFFGKCLWESPSDILVKNMFQNLRGVAENDKKLKDAFLSLPVVSAKEFFEISNFLFILFYETCNLDPQIVSWRNELSSQQAQIGGFIQEQKQKPLLQQYPYQYERQLMGKVKTGDRSGARDILNCMLATIMLTDPGDLDVFKARLLELVSILSRSAVEGGADIKEVLGKNLNYVKMLMEIGSQQELSAWIGKATYDFIELVYEKQDSRKVTQIQPAIEFIESNYSNQISLADIAHAAHLSISRLAHLFKEQLGMTMVDYISQTRIEKARQLLLYTSKTAAEVCFEVGYNNKSYFTRIFRKYTSLTPQQFRKDNRR